MGLVRSTQRTFQARGQEVGGFGQEGFVVEEIPPTYVCPGPRQQVVDAADLKRVVVRRCMVVQQSLQLGQVVAHLWRTSRVGACVIASGF